MAKTKSPGFTFSIDRGGTFTDIYAETPSGRPIVMKLLSEDPANYQDAPREGIRRIMEKELGVPMPVNQPIDSSLISWIRMGTTVATNALLERKGERIALLITEGYRDLLHIGNQTRPGLFDLTVTCPETLYEQVVEVRERVVLKVDECGLDWSGKRAVQGTNGDSLYVMTELDRDRLVKDLRRIHDDGITSIAVAFIHSYIYPDHEKAVSEVAMEMGFSHVSVSSEVMSMVRIIPRGFTACADGYLTPIIKKYVKSFSRGFSAPERLNVLFMQSDGGLTPMERFIGARAILSGPAGGVVGFAMTTYHHDAKQPVIGFDMGGTSTDVSRYDGEYEHVFETTTAGVSIQAPQLDISTVASGGGSRLIFRSGLFEVGPESAGAHPGPTCYGKGGPLAITDANLVLGRLIPEYFPKIFGPSEDQPLDLAASLEAFDTLTAQVNTFLTEQGNKPLDRNQVAMGFIQVANESMCRPIRALTQGKGYDTAHHALACFGGAGGQHACAIARSLGMKTVFIHRYSGILSAYGLALADVVHEEQEPCSKIYTGENLSYFDQRVDSLTEKCFATLQSQGYSRDCISVTAFLHMRYDKTDCPLMCTGQMDSFVSEQKKKEIEGDKKEENSSCKSGNFEAVFLNRYMREFGFTIPGRAIVVDDIRVRAIAKVMVHQPVAMAKAETPVKVMAEVECYFEEGLLLTKVYSLEDLMFGHSVDGPAIVKDKNSTILVEPDCTAGITEYGDVRIEVGQSQSQSVRSGGTVLDAIQLSIFSHRFMSIAEQMGRVLQRTSISTNIKERLDYSCALFGPDGGLVANAPHIPVHLGSMQDAVKYQIRTLGDDLHDGDVIISNHPAAAGCHLPDITVITPVFYPGHEKPVFYVANRGHHADIGGITPGSMPANSRYLWEEGLQVKSFKLVRGGVFQEEKMTELLLEPAKYPGCSGARNLHDNISDLRAQVAANIKGISLVKELISFYGMSVVMAYMGYIQENAELCVRDMLREICQKAEKTEKGSVFAAVDHLDDGSILQLEITIDEKEGSAVFDFTGTGPQVPFNLNAPQTITRSAVLYCLRCLVGHNVPLNQGCFKPITLVIPKGSLLDPSDEAAVIGGNVETSQRLVDVVLKAFKVCAASQGSMNNVTFGSGSFGYYETVAGGAGAGPHWNGRSGVHTHMTNTRITDPEIMERRYPVILTKFHLNPGTGGEGLFTGGDGVVREMLFRTPLQLSVLSDRRVYQPYGMEGGQPGSLGLNTLILKNGAVKDLGGRATVQVEPGDTFRLETPSGGGYGNKEANDRVLPADTPPAKRTKAAQK